MIHQNKLQTHTKTNKPLTKTNITFKSKHNFQKHSETLETLQNLEYPKNDKNTQRST